MRKFLVILFCFVSLSCFGQFGEFFKFSTIYASMGVNTSLFNQGVYQMEDGNLVDITKDEPYNYGINIGIRKIARFDYQSKKGEFYTGEEIDHSDKSLIGAVEGFEYKAQIEYNREQGRNFENRHIFLRYLGDFYTLKAEQLYNGRADIEFQSLDTRLRLKIGNKINLSAGVMNAWRPLGYEYNAIECYEVCSKNPWWQLAYDRGFQDEYWYYDGEGNGVDDYYDYFDWRWFDEDGNHIAETDYEFYQYHFPNIVREYQIEVQDSLGMVREMSLAFGGSFYHYEERFWLHAWGDFFPKRWLEEVDVHTLAHIDLEQERLDFALGFILGTKIGKNKNFGFFIEGNYNHLYEREFFSIASGINYLIY